MENSEATCNIYERWEFSVVITDPHLKKRNLHCLQKFQTCQTSAQKRTKHEFVFDDTK